MGLCARPLFIYVAPVQCTLVFHGHKAVPLVVGEGAERAIDRDLLEVGAQTMAVGVVVGE